MSMPETCKPVPGEGPLTAKLMIVGEALGYDESVLERPFMGQAGQFLDKVLERAGISRQTCYITNAVRCRPTKNGGRSNRPPSKSEIEACLDWLIREVNLVQPEIIVTLGMIPTRSFLWQQMKSTTRLGEMVGRVYEFGISTNFESPKQVVPCYHPSYIMQHAKSDVENMVNIFRKVKDALRN